MKNLMLDIETMGTDPGCAIVSIGAVEFEPETGKMGNTFYRTIDLGSCLKAGFTISASTLMWWLEQNEHARLKLKQDPTELSAALTEFSNWVALNGNTIFWGNSASFDCGILAAAYDKLNMKRPWFYLHEKCYRTVTKLFPLTIKIKKDESISHDPIYDCQYQIKVLAATMKKIKGLK